MTMGQGIGDPNKGNKGHLQSYNRPMNRAIWLGIDDLSRLPLEITHEEELWMAHRAALQLVLATGETLAQLLHEVPTMMQALYVNLCARPAATKSGDQRADAHRHPPSGGT